MNEENKNVYNKEKVYNKEFKKELSELQLNDIFNGTVKVIGKFVPGPVVFTVSDGYKTIEAVIRQSTFDVDDIIDIQGKAMERNGALRLEIDKIRKSEKNFDDILAEKSKPVRDTTTINSEVYNQLLPTMQKIAARLRKAVLDGQPIIVRHHCDTDGYVSGLCIEKPCVELMKEVGINPDYNMYRSACRAPFYEFSDMIKDFQTAVRLDKKGQKKPLVIILDNGSSSEDYMGLECLHAAGIECMVVDHHQPGEIVDGKTSVCKFLSHHLNTHLAGVEDVLSAGMLAYEIGKMIYDFDLPLYPAAAGVADRYKSSEVDQYIANSGKTREELVLLDEAMDFLAWSCKFDLGKETFEEIFSNDVFVKAIATKVEKGRSQQMMTMIPAVEKTDFAPVTLATIDLQKYSMKFTYPRSGKMVGEIQDELAKTADKALLTIGVFDDMWIIRATEPIFPVGQIISKLQADFPEASVEGGGHDQAGSMKFVMAYKDEVMNKLKEYLGAL